MSNTCVTDAWSSQNNSITTREMCNAAVTKVRFNRLQFTSRASIPFSLPHSTIVHGELWNEIRGWALHSWDCWAESCFCSLIGKFITLDTSMTWYPNQGNRVSGIDQLTVSEYMQFLTDNWHVAIWVRIRYSLDLSLQLVFVFLLHY